MNNQISHERLVQLLSYDKRSGLFTRIISVPGFRAGSIAGSRSERGYIAIKIDGITYKAHRLAWFYVHAEWPEEHIDHINGDTGDNTFSNLRQANRFQNLANCRRYKNSTSNFKGVSWHKSSGKWCAYIQARRKRIHLGLFANPNDAYAAYLHAARKYHGSFARAA